MQPIYNLIHSGGEYVQMEGTPNRFRKAIIQVGEWLDPRDMSQRFRVTLDRMKTWVANFEAKLLDRVPVPLRHTDDPRANTGYVQGLSIDGDTLYAEMEFTDPDIAGKVSDGSIADVSLSVDPAWTHPQKGTTHEVLRHVALTMYPRAQGLSSFEPINAEQGGRENVVMVNMEMATKEGMMDGAADGSYEQLKQKICDAACMFFPSRHVMVEFTFPDHAILCVHAEDYCGEPKYFDAKYTAGADGMVMIGEMQAVKRVDSTAFTPLDSAAMSQEPFEPIDLADIPANEDKLKKARQVRSAKYDIEETADGNLTPPKEFAALKEAQFADPVNYKYPIDSAHVAAAMRYFSKPENRKGYKLTRSRQEVWNRIIGAMKSMKMKHEFDKTDELDKGMPDALKSWAMGNANMEQQTAGRSPTNPGEGPTTGGDSMDEKLLEQMKADKEAAEKRAIELEQSQAEAEKKAQADLAAATAKAVELEQALEARDVAELEQRVESLVAAGKITPAMAKQVKPVLMATRGKAVDFEDKKGESATATLLAVLESLPAQIDFEQKGRPGGGDVVEFTRKQIQNMTQEEWQAQKPQIEAAIAAGRVR